MDVSTRHVAPEVAIISARAETLTGLQSYLRSAGVMTRGVKALEDLPRLAKQTSIACFVLFPDDYRWEAVIAAIADVATRRRDLLPILVTAHPKRFEQLTDGEPVVVVPRPAWSWTILDVIRAHASSTDSSQERAARERRV